MHRIRTIAKSLKGKILRTLAKGAPFDIVEVGEGRLWMRAQTNHETSFPREVIEAECSRAYLSKGIIALGRPPSAPSVSSPDHRGGQHTKTSNNSSHAMFSRSPSAGFGNVLGSRVAPASAYAR